MLRHDAFDAWMTAYGAAWLSNDAADVAALFGRDATYSVGPFAQPWTGRTQIVEEWTSDPLGQRDIEFAHDVLAVDGDVGVARWRVAYTTAADGRRFEMDGVLVARFAPGGADAGRCVAHEEWYDRRELSP